MTASSREPKISAISLVHLSKGKETEMKTS